MKNQKWVNPRTNRFFKAVLKLENLGEARKFFRDLLTEQEIEEFAGRWEVACMLSKNTPYSKIAKETGMSSTTIARISKWLNKGMGGYKLLIKKFNKQINHRSPA